MIFLFLCRCRWQYWIHADYQQFLLTFPREAAEDSKGSRRAWSRLRSRSPTPLRASCCTSPAPAATRFPPPRDAEIACALTHRARGARNTFPPNLNNNSLFIAAGARGRHRRHTHWSCLFTKRIATLNFSQLFFNCKPQKKVQQVKKLTFTSEKQKINKIKKFVFDLWLISVWSNQVSSTVMMINSHLDLIAFGISPWKFQEFSP